MKARNPKVDPTSASLIERVKVNQEGAWDELARLYQGLLNEWMESYRKHKHPIQDSDVEDIIQNVWVGVRSNFETFVLVTGRRSFRPWLRTIVARRIADHVRKKNQVENERRIKNATDIVADTEEEFSSLEDIAQNDIKEFDEVVGIDDEKEKAIVLDDAMNIICEHLGINPKHLEIFSRWKYANRTNASIGSELGVSENNVSVIAGRVESKIQENIENGMLAKILEKTREKYELFLE